MSGKLKCLYMRGVKKAGSTFKLWGMEEHIMTLIDKLMESEEDTDFDDIVASYLRWKKVDPQDCPPLFILNNLQELVRFAFAFGADTHF